MSSDELKSCPFCGGDAETRRARQQEDGRWFPAMCGCRRCGVWMRGDETYRTRGFASESDYEESMGQAVRRWNDRDADATSTRQGVGTCRNISNPPSGFLCSECGWGDFAEPSHLLTTAKYTDNDKGPNYCPNCGKRIVEVDE